MGVYSNLCVTFLSSDVAYSRLPEGSLLAEACARALDSALRKLSVYSEGRLLISIWYRLIEFQAFLVELVSTFEFALTEEAKHTRRESHGVMVPFIEGQPDQEAHLPLKVTFALNGAE